MTVNVLDSNIDSAVEVIKDFLGKRKPYVGLILGSGLNPLADEISDAVVIPFKRVPFMGISTADGHVGQFVCGMLGGVCVLAMQGRLHGYEGYSAQQVAFPVWVMNRLGIQTLIATNAAGALNPNFCVGDFCIMTDQINATGRNPIAALDPANLSERFFSMRDAFDKDLRRIAFDVAQTYGVRVQEGIYLGVLGPSFETPAEIRMFQSWGADTVAMSVCEEVIAARHMGMRVLGISLVSNMGCGIEGSNPDGNEVMDVAKGCEEAFSCLITRILEQI